MATLTTTTMKRTKVAARTKKWEARMWRETVTSVYDFVVLVLSDKAAITNARTTIPGKQTTTTMMKKQVKIKTAATENSHKTRKCRKEEQQNKNSNKENNHNENRKQQYSYSNDKD